MSYPIQRRHPRIPFAQVPWIFALELPQTMKDESPLRVEPKNISVGGLKFVTNMKFPLFTELRVELFQKENGQVVSAVEGKVIRVEEVDTGYGERSFGIAIEFNQGEGQELRPVLDAQP